MAATTTPPTLRGRTAEVHELDQAVQRALSGQLTRVLIEGEAGIGKTRLLTEALDLASSRGFEVATASANEMQQTRPFGVIADALSCRPGASGSRRREIAALLATHQSSARGAITISSDPGLHFRAVDAFEDLVETMALVEPIVIGLDDLQWADPSSLLTLSAIAHSTLGLPVLLIACYRSFPQPPSLRQTLQRLPRSGTFSLRLDPLGAADVHDVIRETLGAEPDSRLLHQASAAAGNPLYLLELLASMLEEGPVRTVDGHTEAFAETFPPSLSLTILSRLSALPESTLRVLRIGSLLGSRFSPIELAAVAEQAVHNLAPALEAAIAAGVLEDDGTSLHFRHDVIRGAIYADMSASVRIGLHRDAAARLAAVAAPAARVAEQFARGALPGDAEAIDWLTRAGREMASASPETAAAFLQRAHDLMKPDDPCRDRLLSERADSLMLAGRVSEAIAACQDLVERPHDATAEVPVRLRLGAALLVNGRPVEALRELDAVTGSPTSTPAERAHGLSEAATAHLWLGEFERTDSAAERALPLAVETNGHSFAVASLATRSVVACMRGRMQQAIELNDKALQVAQTSPELSGHGFPVYATRGWILLEVDDTAGSQRALAAGRRLCEELGIRWPLATYQAYLAVAKFFAGEWDDVAAELAAGITFAQETGVTYALKPSYSALATIRLHRGDLPNARAAIESATGVGDRGSRLFDYRLLLAEAQVLEAEGDARAALRTLADRWQLCQDVGMAVDYAAVGPDLVRLARANGRMQLAQEVTAAVQEVAAANDVASISGAALRCRALLTDDSECWAQAIDYYAAGHRRLELALTCEEAAELAARRAEEATARALLYRADDIYDCLDATRCQNRVDAGLRKLGVRRGRRGPRQRPQWGWESLTPTETRIADLVAEGLTNPQIGARLFVSRRTVQTHVSHIFTKLDIGSRAQLAGQVAKRRGDKPEHALQ